MSIINKKITQGLGTFNVADSVAPELFEDNPTVISFEEYLKIILANLANKIPFDSDFYVRVVDDRASLTYPLSSLKWHLNDIVFVKVDKVFYKVTDLSDYTKWEVIFSGGGTTVIANPTLVGTEASLTGIQIDGTKYKVSDGGAADEYLVKVTTDTSISGVNDFVVEGKNTSGSNYTHIKTPSSTVVDKVELKDKILTITTRNLNDGSTSSVQYGASTGGFATTEQLTAETNRAKGIEDTKVDITSRYGNWKDLVQNNPSSQGPALITQYIDATGNVKFQAGVGVNNSAGTGTDALMGQYYAINYDTKKGARLGIRQDGIYYTKNKTDATIIADDDEIITKKDLPSGLNLKAGTNISLSTSGGETTIASTSIDDTTAATDTGKSYSHSKINELLQNKTTRVLDGTNGKSYVFNESDGGGAKFEGNNKIYSYVGVNDGGGNIYAQIYNWQYDAAGTTPQTGVILDVGKNKIYYYTGTYASSTARDVDENEIAVKGDVAAEKTRAEGAENTLNTAINTEKTRAEGVETTLDGKFANYYGKYLDSSTSKDSNTYNATQIDTELGKKAGSFNIDTTMLQWDESTNPHTLKTKFGNPIYLAGQVSAYSGLPTPEASIEGAMYIVGSTTAQVRDLYICVPGDTSGSYTWTRGGDTSIDLTQYYKKTETYSKAEIDTALATKQATLVNQNNISSLGSNLAEQKNLLTSKIILFKIKGGKLSSEYSNINIKATCTHCSCEGTATFEETRAKSTLDDLELTFDADKDYLFTATTLSVMLDTVALTQNTDYSYSIGKGGESSVVIFTATGLAKLKVASAIEVVITPVATPAP